jgi:hypothetical protein
MKSKITVLWFALIVIEMLLLGCSKKAEAHENPNTGNAKTEVYNSESDFETETSDDGKSITITKYKGNATTVKIPENINNLPVIRIGNNAFSKTEITSVKIPDSVTNIGGEAFYGCNNLTSVTIPDSVIEIRMSAFQNCTNLKSVNLPNNLIVFGPRIFKGCSKLENITIPDSVYLIGNMAFQDCDSLKSINIPSAVTKIGIQAFDGCKRLTSVIFASGSNINDADFDRDAFPEGKVNKGGNTLKTTYNTGKAGTYTRGKNDSTWTKK